MTLPKEKKKNNYYCLGGVVGDETKMESHQYTSREEAIVEKCQAPIISVSESTSEIILKINQSTAKFNAEDPIRTKMAIDHYTNYIDINKII